MGELTATGNGHLENTEVTSVRQESTRNAGQSIKVFIKSQALYPHKIYNYQKKSSNFKVENHNRISEAKGQSTQTVETCLHYVPQGFTIRKA